MGDILLVEDDALLVAALRRALRDDTLLSVTTCSEAKSQLRSRTRSAAIVNHVTFASCYDITA